MDVCSTIIRRRKKKKKNRKGAFQRNMKGTQETRLERKWKRDPGIHDAFAMVDVPGIQVRAWGSTRSWKCQLAFPGLAGARVPLGTSTQVRHGLKLVRRGFPSKTLGTQLIVPASAVWVKSLGRSGQARRKGISPTPPSHWASRVLHAFLRSNVNRVESVLK